jgi:DNA-binding NtrC family response regulator
MPQMSGQELAERIVALRPGMKVVFMSGYPRGITSVHGMFEPGGFFLQKPFQMDTLGRMLRQVVGSDKPMETACVRQLVSTPKKNGTHGIRRHPLARAGVAHRWMSPQFWDERVPQYAARLPQD